jgi:hypothetical protein
MTSCLANLLFSNNGALALLDGRQYLSVAWYSNWREMIKGLQKIFLQDCVTHGSRWASSQSKFYSQHCPLHCLFFSKESPFGFCFHLLCLKHIIVAFAAVKMSYSPLLTLLAPLGALLVWFTQLRSALLTTRDQGIT